MRGYTMDQYTLQSYFKSVCNSFCIAYKQLKRLEEKKEEVFQGDIKKHEEFIAQILFWMNRQLNDAHSIESAITAMKDQDYTIIITSKDEITVLMSFFREKSVSEYRIINLDDQYLDCFPKDDISEEFLKAYISCNEDEMKKVCKKYF